MAGAKASDATQFYTPAKTTVAKPAVPPQKEMPPAGKQPGPPDATQLLSSASPGAPGTVFSATRVMGPADTPLPPRKDTQAPKRADLGGPAKSRAGTEVTDKTVILGAASKEANAGRAVTPPPGPRDSGTGSVAPAKTKAGRDVIAQLLPILKNPAVLGGAGAVLIVIIVVAVWAMRGESAAASDKKLKQQADELWNNRQFDQSEEIWRKIAKAKGALEREATHRITEIDQERAEDQRQFDAGMQMLADKKDCIGAQQAFRAVMATNLWHAEEGAHELSEANACTSAMDEHQQEKNHFDQGVALFQAKDYEKAAKEFHAALDLKVADSTLKTEAESYLNRIRQSATDQKVLEAANQDLKNENWAGARDQFQELIKRKVPQSSEAKKQLPTAEKALQTLNSVEGAIRGGSYKTAKSQLDSAQQWPKTRDNLTKELRTREQEEFDGIRNSAQAAETKGDPTAISHAIDELRGFEGRAEDRQILESCKGLDDKLNGALTAAIKNSGDNAAFDKAVADYNQAVQKKDVDALAKGVMEEFKKIANGTGSHHAAAAQYVSGTIPNEIQTLKQSEGKVLVPAIECGPGKGAPEVPSVGGSVPCSQLDAALAWVGVATVDFPNDAKQPLPYTVTVLVTAEPNGNVKVEKDGNPDKNFFNKVKDASKHWKTAPPKSQSKPVSVRFALTVTFQR